MFKWKWENCCKHPTYKTWAAMKRRCANPSDENFHNYGGRGISVCERWKNSYDAFIEDMGLRPEGTTIERKDNNGNYEPGNCIWATETQQNRNRRTNRWITFDGRTQTLKEWATEFRMTSCLLRLRIESYGEKTAMALKDRRAFNRSKGLTDFLEYDL